MSNADTLRAADADASGPTDGQASDTTSAPCPKERFVIEVEVAGEDDSPISGLVVAVKNGDNAGLRGGTNSNGSVRFEGLEAGSYQISLAELDKDAWELISTEALEPSQGKVPHTADLQPLTFQEQSAFVHTITRGECAAKLSIRHGFFPETLWDHPDNADLRSDRESLFVLHDGDPLSIPKPEPHWMSAQTENRYHLKRKGIPETIRLQFLDARKKPREGLDYLYHVETEDGQVLADKTGQIDAQGYLTEPIPPLATQVDLTIGRGKDAEHYSLAVGHQDEVSTTIGQQTRLSNLGFYTGDQDGEMRDELTEALRNFQQFYELDITGEPDQATQDKLKDINRG